MTKRHLLITVSGMVGSGKTTAAQHVVSVLGRRGLKADYWRFQRLPCFDFSIDRRRKPSRAPAQSRSRSQTYQQSPLTLSRALGYAARIVAFRIYRRLPGAPRVAVTNRYFYDNLVHYTLDRTTSRVYGWVLSRMIPKPDLSVLLVASPATLSDRRPSYTSEYIRDADAAYRRLIGRVPELLTISSDPGHQTLQQVEKALEQRVLNRGV